MSGEKRIWVQGYLVGRWDSAGLPSADIHPVYVLVLFWECLSLEFVDRDFEGFSLALVAVAA